MIVVKYAYNKAHSRSIENSLYVHFSERILKYVLKSSIDLKDREEGAYSPGLNYTWIRLALYPLVLKSVL